MDALTRHRKIRLQALIDGKPYDGNQAKFAAEAGLTKARITQLLDPSDSFGERAARGLCDKLNLTERYFEHGFGAATNDMPPDPAALAPANTAELTRALEKVETALGKIKATTPSTTVHIEHAWPFSQIKREQWAALSDEQKAIVESVALGMLATQYSAGAADKRQPTG